MSGAGFLRGTMSPARTMKSAARSSPTTCVRTARTDGSADVDATASAQPAAAASSTSRATPVPAGQHLALAVLVGGQPGRGDERRRQQTGHPLLAAADQQLLRVLVLAPPHRQAELGERLVERGQVAVALGVGEHA